MLDWIDLYFVIYHCMYMCVCMHVWPSFCYNSNRMYSWHTLVQCIDEIIVLVVTNFGTGRYVRPVLERGKRWPCCHDKVFQGIRGVSSETDASGRNWSNSLLLLITEDTDWPLYYLYHRLQKKTFYCNDSKNTVWNDWYQKFLYCLCGNV